MIIKIGRTEIKYNTPEQDDFMIISCIPSSGMSSDKPTLIRTVQDLRLSFGEKFPEFSYLSELLGQGVTLYLMGPTKSSENTNFNGHIQFSGYADGFYTEHKSNDYSFNGFLVKTLPESAQQGIIYKVIDDEGIKVGGPTGKYSEYTFLDGWINTRDLPQNTWINTDSQNNRDTLRLCSEGLYCHPKYGEYINPAAPYNSIYYQREGGKWIEKEGIWDSPEYIFNSLEELEDAILKPKEKEIARIDNYISLSVIDPSRIDNEEDSLAFLVEGNGAIREEEFIALGDILYGNPPVDLLKVYTPKEVVSVTSIDQFLVIAQRQGWKIEGNYLIPKDLSANITYFYQHSSLKIIPDWRKSQQLVASYTTPIIDFSSKTIGSEGPESWITIKTEDLEEEGTQRVTISRYGYVEVFEGSWIKGSIEGERLDYKISKESKLVEATYYEGIPPEGEWVLRGAEGLEEENKEKTLEFIFNSETLIDFFLSYGDLPQKTLLEYAKQKDCQCLIQNQGEDYKENLEDKTNHLLFFYRPMALYGVLSRPSWYIWLRGLLSDIYSDTADNISYDSPAPEYDEDNKLCRELKKYRSNYLTSSGLSIFYRSYAWMGDKETAFARFVLGKISRELEKNKWSFIGPQPGGSTIPSIKKILQKIKKSFGIIRSIEVADYDFYYRKNLIELTLETRISDLPDKDISLDITLNYNN